jgi:Penicillin-insensitive murein endopeptidase
MANNSNFYLLPQLGGCGYISYSPRDRQFGTKKTIETIMQLASDYFINEGVEIQIGDMSFESGATMSPHSTHKDGKCMDIRPMRKDKKHIPINISQDQYDKSATELFVKVLLAHENVKKVLFNDSTIGGVHWCKGHDNHLHVTFHH